MSIVYLACLLGSLGAMALLDWRYRLFFWDAPVRAAAVLACGLVFFMVWDLFGIALGIFYRGETTIMTGVQIVPDLPLEEPVFLLFLCYLTMVLYTGVLRMVWHAPGRTRSRS